MLIPLRHYITLNLLSILIIGMLSHNVVAEDFCVSTATELQAALTTAQNNGEDDIVQVVQGTYVGNFLYASVESTTLSLLGGYISECESRLIDPANTVVDADYDGRSLTPASESIFLDKTSIYY